MSGQSKLEGQHLEGGRHFPGRFGKQYPHPPGGVGQERGVQCRRLERGCKTSGVKLGDMDSFELPIPIDAWPRPVCNVEQLTSRGFFRWAETEGDFGGPQVPERFATMLATNDCFLRFPGRPVWVTQFSAGAPNHCPFDNQAMDIGRVLLWAYVLWYVIYCLVVLAGASLSVAQKRHGSVQPAAVTWYVVPAFNEQRHLHCVAEAIVTRSLDPGADRHC